MTGTGVLLHGQITARTGERTKCSPSTQNDVAGRKRERPGVMAKDITAVDSLRVFEVDAASSAVLSTLVSPIASRCMS